MEKIRDKNTLRATGLTTEGNVFTLEITYSTGAQKTSEPVRIGGLCYGKSSGAFIDIERVSDGTFIDLERCISGKTAWDCVPQIIAQANGWDSDLPSVLI